MEILRVRVEMKCNVRMRLKSTNSDVYIIILWEFCTKVGWAKNKSGCNKKCYPLNIYDYI